MKHFSILFCLFCSASFYAQDGFKLLRKAEHVIERGEYQRALKLLDKAQKADYGFCGNAHMEAHYKIAYLRAKISMSMENYAEAADLLNVPELFFNNDSLKIALYAKAYGKERVRREVDSCLALIPSFRGDQAPNELTLGLSFAKDPVIISMEDITVFTEEDNVVILKYWIESIRKLPFYIQLM